MDRSANTARGGGFFARPALTLTQCPGKVCSDGFCSKPCKGGFCKTRNGRDFTLCAGNSCYCFGASDGSAYCGFNDFCSKLTDCNSDKDCSVDSRCAVKTCCGRNVCIVRCQGDGNQGVSLTTPRNNNGRTPAGGPGEG